MENKSKKEMAELYTKYKNINFTEECVADIQIEYDKAIVNLYKELIGKSQQDVGKAFHALNEMGFSKNIEDIRKPFMDMAIDRHKKLEQEKSDTEKILISFAKIYLPEHSNEQNIVDMSYKSTYYSQGLSADKYAKVSLIGTFTLLSLLDYNPEYKENDMCYEVWANISEFDYWMLKHSEKFISFLNWAVLCWKNGCNPKVYCPIMLDKDYDKSMDLAYRCNYNVTKDNMSLELSREEIEELKRR